MFNDDPTRTAYGLEAVVAAVSLQAVSELLITDKVYRTDDFAERNKFVELMEEVKNAGGQVYKFSSLHVSGEKLDCYTGIAATLRFSVEVAEIDVPPVEELKLHEKAPDVVPSSGGRGSGGANTTSSSAGRGGNTNTTAGRGSSSTGGRGGGNNVTKPANNSKNSGKPPKKPSVYDDDDYYDY